MTLTNAFLFLNQSSKWGMSVSSTEWEDAQWHHQNNALSWASIYSVSKHGSGPQTSCSLKSHTLSARLPKASVQKWWGLYQTFCFSRTRVCWVFWELMQMQHRARTVHSISSKQQANSHLWYFRNKDNLCALKRWKSFSIFMGVVSFSISKQLSPAIS